MAIFYYFAKRYVLIKNETIKKIGIKSISELFADLRFASVIAECMSPSRCNLFFSRIALCLHFHRPYQTFRLPRMTADNMDSFFPSPFHPHILYKNISRRQPRQGKVISELAAGILMRILSSGKFTQKIKTDFKTSAILKLQSIDSRECTEGIPQISLPQKGELR